MTMTTIRVDQSEARIVVDLAREQVARMAPDELKFYRATSEAYLRDPRAIEAQAGDDEMLGFGLESGVTLLTPIVLTVTTEVVKFVASEVRKAAEAESSGMIRDFVRKVFGWLRRKDKMEEHKALPPLTQEQLVAVRRLAFEKGCQLKLSEAQAGLLADSLIGSLLTTASQERMEP